MKIDSFIIKWDDMPFGNSLSVSRNQEKSYGN